MDGASRNEASVCKCLGWLLKIDIEIINSKGEVGGGVGIAKDEKKKEIYSEDGKKGRKRERNGKHIIRW